MSGKLDRRSLDGTKCALDTAVEAENAVGLEGLAGLGDGAPGPSRLEGPSRTSSGVLGASDTDSAAGQRIFLQPERRRSERRLRR